MIYVISTLSNDQLYCNYTEREDVKVVSKEILIKGGANIQNRRTLFASSQGVITPISEADFAELEKNPLFKFHQNRGFITIRKTNESDANKVAEKMTTKDISAQKTPEDYIGRKINGKIIKKAPTTDINKIMTDEKE